MGHVSLPEYQLQFSLVEIIKYDFLPCLLFKNKPSDWWDFSVKKCCRFQPDQLGHSAIPRWLQLYVVFQKNPEKRRRVWDAQLLHIGKEKTRWWFQTLKHVV